MDLQGLLILAFFGLLDLSPGMSISRNSMKEVSFESKLRVQNRTVECGKLSSAISLDHQMYTCNDISVDGWKVFYGINDYKLLSKIPQDNNNGCPGCPCGSYTAQPTDVYALCSALLTAQGVSDDLMAAYTPHPTCVQTKEERRVKFFTQDKETHWLNVKANNGYLSKLQCMVF